MVKGDNVILFIYDGGIWKPYACALGEVFAVDTDSIETSVSGGGKNASFMPTKNSFTISLSGLVSLQVAGNLTLPDLRQRQLAQQNLLLRLQRTDENAQVYTDECTAFFTNTTDTGNYGGLNTFSAEMRGTGAITQIFTPQPPTPPGGVTVKRYPQVGSTAPVAPGTTVINIPLLIGKDILEVVKDGIGNNDIIITGTPVAKEVKYTSATGDFEWGIPFDGESFYILYQDM